MARIRLKLILVGLLYCYIIISKTSFTRIINAALIRLLPVLTGLLYCYGIIISSCGQNCLTE